jgi:hypothetical protein
MRIHEIPLYVIWGETESSAIVSALDICEQGKLQPEQPAPVFGPLFGSLLCFDVSIKKVYQISILHGDVLSRIPLGEAWGSVKLVFVRRATCGGRRCGHG